MVRRFALALAAVSLCSAMAGCSSTRATQQSPSASFTSGATASTDSITNDYLTSAKSKALDFDAIFEKQPGVCRTSPDPKYESCANVAREVKAQADVYLQALAAAAVPSSLAVANESLRSALEAIGSQETAIIDAIDAGEITRVPALLDTLHEDSVAILNAFCAVGIGRPPTCIPS
jgi:hypothetical protein